MWCWKWIENINWTDRVRNYEVLQRVKKERNILHTIKRRKANWIDHILHSNCLVKQVNEGKKQERREEEEEDVSNYSMIFRKKRLHWKLREEALESTRCRTHFGRGCWPVVRRTEE